jgi:hypothetical protein
MVYLNKFHFTQKITTSAEILPNPLILFFSLKRRVEGAGGENGKKGRGLFIFF